MRRSNRLSSSGKRSSYFEDAVDGSASDDPIAPSQPSKRKSRSKAAKLDSEEEFDEVQSAQEAPHFDGGDEDENSDKTAAAPPTKRPRGRPPKATPKKALAGNDGTSSLPRKRGRPSKNTPAKKAKTEPEEEEDDDDDDDDSDDDGPRVEFIPLPKLRETGGIDYEPERLHPNTMEFLKDLKANNTRSWLKSELSPPHAHSTLRVVLSARLTSVGSARPRV